MSFFPSADVIFFFLRQCTPKQFTFVSTVLLFMFINMDSSFHLNFSTFISSRIQSYLMFQSFKHFEQSDVMLRSDSCAFICNTGSELEFSFADIMKATKNMLTIIMSSIPWRGSTDIYTQTQWKENWQ